MQTKDPEERVEYYTWNNLVRRMAYSIVGSRKAYDALTRDDREDVRTMSKQLIELGKDIPTAKAAEDTTKQGFVYIITNPAWPNQVKIGRAFDPDSRLRGYQTSCPNRDYRLYAAVYFVDCYFAEREVHERLASCRAEGEWFNITPFLARHTINKLRSII